MIYRIVVIVLVLMVLWLIIQLEKWKKSAKRLAGDLIGEKINYTKTIHEFFGSRNESYLVVPRSIIQASSIKIQHKLVEILEDIKKFENWERQGSYYDVKKKDTRNRYIKDTYKDYSHGISNIKVVQ